MTLPVQLVQTSLQSLDEEELQKRIIQPLLRANGFSNVRGVSGAGESGEDVFATKEEFGSTILYAIQVKRLKINSLHGTNESFVQLYHQLHKAITTDIHDPCTKSGQVPEKLIFITPFSIDRAIYEAASSELRELALNHVQIIDGTVLAEQVIRHIPNIASTLDDRVSYKLYVYNKQNEIREGIAFGRPEGLRVDSIFVEADYSCFDSVEAFASKLQILAPIAGGGGNEPYYKRMTKDEVKLLCEMTSTWTLHGELYNVDSLPVDLDSFELFLIQHVTSLVESIHLISDNAINVDESRAVCRDLANLQYSIHKILGYALFEVGSIQSEKSSESLVHLITTLKSRRRITTYRELARMHGLIAIVGNGGAGKTTLLRRIMMHYVSSQVDFHPVFLRAIEIKGSTLETLFVFMSNEFSASGVRVSVSDVKSWADQGLIRLCIDGLDEAGKMANSLVDMIKKFWEKYPLNTVYVTSRDVVDLKRWGAALHIRLCEFSPEQLNDFTSNWFPSEPAKVYEVREVVRNVSAVKKLASVPIFAALLCSLCDAGVDIPTTELELYSARIDLLLGKWEEAKDIPPMAGQYRRRYYKFLIELAKAIHDEGERTAGSAVVQNYAMKWHVTGYNKSVDSFITDCVGRNLLESNLDMSYTFGHLTYQEHLVGMYYEHHNPIDEIISKIGQSWWSKPLDFYCAAQGDITLLLKKIDKHKYRNNIGQIQRMISYASLTPYSEAKKF